MRGCVPWGRAHRLDTEKFGNRLARYGRCSSKATAASGIQGPVSTQVYTAETPTLGRTAALEARMSTGGLRLLLGWQVATSSLSFEIRVMP